MRLRLSLLACWLILFSLAAAPAAAGNCVPWPGSLTGWAVGSQGAATPAILHTANGGGFWQRQGQDAGLPQAPLYAVEAVDDCRAWAVGGVADGYAVILHTTDGGRTWRRQGDAASLPGLELYGITAADRRTAWAVGGQGLILRTDDGGRSWRRQGAGQVAEVELSDAYAADRHTVWVVGDQLGEMGAIYRTTDGGANWSRQSYTPRPDVVERYLLACQGIGELYLWIVGRGTALVTHDGGRTWRDATPSEARGFYDINGVAVGSRTAVWVVNDNDGIFRYHGASWSQQTPAVFGHYLLGAAATDAENLWVAGRRNNPNASWGVIMGSSDGGESWLDQRPGLGLALMDVSMVRAAPALD
jgi:photosystem II stability/assembly factor-like uncharacterized protein